MSSLPMKVVAIAMVAFAVFQRGYCFDCYKGDEGTTATTSCSGSCMKATGKLESSDEVSVYDCSPIKYEEGCTSGTFMEVTAELCYCNTDLCNSSSVSSVALPLLLGALLLKMVI